MQGTVTSSVKLINWTPAFSVGVAKLDSEHKRIIEVINTLTTHQNLSAQSEVISQALDQLINYAKEHFQSEERLLASLGYPDLSAQRKSHRGFLRAISNHCSAAMSRSESLPQDLLKFTRDWWENHILKDDMQYRAFVSARSVR